jgi:4-hydroxyphenylpyruvate dioxygenase
VKTSIATVSLSGTLQTKLEAIARAGFDGFELFDADLTAATESPEAVRSMAADLGLTIFALQPFRDFEGLLDARRSAAFGRAERKFDLMERLGTNLLLVPSSCSPDAVDGIGRAAEDLHELGERAARRGFRIGYEALAWGRFVRDWTTAWEIVQRADHSGVGLVVDTYHLFVRGNPISPLRHVPADRIALVQLADAPSLDMEVLRHSRHMRNFPGQGDYPVASVISELLAVGYDGVLSHEIFNDDFRTAPADQTATDGYRSMVWLEEQLLAQSSRPSLLVAQPSEPPQWTQAPRPLPRPAVTGFSFIEFAVSNEAERASLTDLLRRLGFSLTHRHRSKAVDLFEMGGAWMALNAEPSTYTSDLASIRRTFVSGIGIQTDDAAALLSRTAAYRCDEIKRAREAGEMPLPAIAGVGGSLVYLVDASAPHFTLTDFDPVDVPLAGFATTTSSTTSTAATRSESAPGSWLTIDHVAQAVAPYELLSALLFYRAALGLELQPPMEFADLGGLVTSRTVVSGNGAVRIPLNTAASASTSPERFRSTVHGSGVQHIAFAATDLNLVLQSIDKAIVLPIGSNYYDDLAARFDLDKEAVRRLAADNLLYDRQGDGEYLHLYTEEIHGVFFEFVQRVSYSGFGAANAPIRLAAQAASRASQ